MKGKGGSRGNDQLWTASSRGGGRRLIKMRDMWAYLNDDGNSRDGEIEAGEKGDNKGLG